MLAITYGRKTKTIANCASLFRYFPTRTFQRKTNVKLKIQPPVAFPQKVDTVGYKTLIKPFAFTVCFSTGVFACAAIWQYESMRKKAQLIIINRTLFGFPSPHTPQKTRKSNGPISALWNSQSDGQKVASVIIALNTIVFLLWRIPRLQPFMTRYFCSTPSSKNLCWPMFLSTFSHYSGFHLFANMYVLYSFSSTSVAFFGKEQFVALYCSAGVISSFTSYLYKVAFKNYGPSLGASGALMAVLSSSCFQFPHARLGILFIPFITISAGNAIKGLMALDCIGLIAKWRVFDHAAHLGGALFGVFYLYHGYKYIWGKRETFVLRWHKLRGQAK